MKWNQALIVCSIFITGAASAQNGSKDKEKVVKYVGQFEVPATQVNALVNNGARIPDDNLASLKANMTALLTSKAALPSNAGDLAAILNDVAADDYLGNKGRTAIIFLYRNMKYEDGNLSIDFKSINYLLYNKERATKDKHPNDWSEYLLNVKHVLFILVDANEAWYDSQHFPEGDTAHQPLNAENTSFTISKVTGFFKQSLTDEISLIEAMNNKAQNGVTAQNNIPQLMLTFIELNPKQIKLPSNIVVSNKSFTKDLTYNLHAYNVASFQNGISMDNLKLSDFSIAQGNLVVAPDSAQKKSWKSSFNILIELHLPRDIDNFNPVWKINTAGKSIGYDIYQLTLQRIGVYGGIKLSTDPLSNLYAGFNYAVSKELALNFGWVWTNTIKPQVDSIGNITSLSDAEAYAKRKYSGGQFSIGLSFSPSAVIKMLGLKSSTTTSTTKSAATK